MKEISSNFSKLSNEVVSQIKNDQGKYKQLRADVEREGIKVKRKVIENGEEKIIEKGEFYDLEKFEEEIKKESNLGIEIEDILSGFSVIAHQGVFGDAFNSMNSDDFKRDIVMKHVYPEGSDYRPNDNSEISIGSSAFNITFIIDETDLKNGKKAYLEMNSPIIDRFGKAMMDDAKTATIGNLIYTFNLKEQTFQLKITSNNPNLEQEQLGKILEFSSINNYLFKSDEEKLQDMLMGVIAELKGNLVQYRYNSAIDEKDLNNVAN